MKINFKLNHPDAKAPTRAHHFDAGNDLYSIENIDLYPGVTKIKTGVSVALPAGTVGVIKDRSSMGIKGLHVYAGVIDHGYTGEISVVLYNMSDKPYPVRVGDKIAQLVVLPISVVDWEQSDSLEATDRGDSGFGSSGK